MVWASIDPSSGLQVNQIVMCYLFNGGEAIVLVLPKHEFVVYFSNELLLLKGMKTHQIVYQQDSL
jgi:hypothetical protein